MKYFLIAGEPSGDLHGSNLMKGLLEEDPAAEFLFWGGDAMASVGGEQNLLKHYKENSLFGIIEVIRNLGAISKQIDECCQSIFDYRPDVLILIDYPGFNMKIAKEAKKRNIKVFYYIAPKVWASRSYRIRAMRRYIDSLFVIFPFEVEYFKKRGFEPHYCGNPLSDALAAKVDALPSRSEFIAANGLENKPIIALLAGSRRSEINANLPLMVEVARHFPQHQFVVAGVEWISSEIYDKYLDGSDIKVVTDQTYQLLTSCEAALITSGTATLEAALLNVPEVVVYRVGWILQLLRPLILNIPFISLVNINLGKECVREIIQSSHTAQPTIEALRKIIEGGEQRERVLADYKKLQEMFGQSGTSRRVATKMVNLLNNR
ncbi:MAG: lipid-A-disaccharide synthase [Rikenellaceae bacterium]